MRNVFSEEENEGVNWILALRDIFHDMQRIEDQGYRLATEFSEIPPSLIRKFCKPIGWYYIIPMQTHLAYYAPEEVRSVFGLLEDKAADNLPSPNPKAIAALEQWRNQNKQNLQLN